MDRTNIDKFNNTKTHNFIISIH